MERGGDEVIKVGQRRAGVNRGVFDSQTQLDISETHGPDGARITGAPIAFSIAELATLNRFRIRAL